MLPGNTQKQDKMSRKYFRNGAWSACQEKGLVGLSREKDSRHYTKWFQSKKGGSFIQGKQQLCATSKV